MNILHITSILPAPLKRKRTENDILVRIAEEYQNQYPDCSHSFILTVPFSNFILSFFKKRWYEYYKLIRKGFYEHNGFRIYVIGIPAFASDQNITSYLSKIGYKLNKKRINFILKKVSPDIIHAQSFGSSIELAEILKLKYKINYLATARGINKRTIVRIQENKLNPLKVLTLNYQVFCRLKNELNIQVELIPHPVDNGFFVLNQNFKVNSKPRFISVGRLLKLKNIDRVILALSKLRIEFIYDIYGVGPEEERLKVLVNDLNLQNKVNFKGWIEHKELKLILNEYDLLLQPSFPETLGRIYLEAMASGVPVLAARNTGVDGLVSNNIEAFLVDCESVDDILSSIQQFVSLNETQKIDMKQSAIKTASLYRWECTLVRYYKFYNV